MKIMNKNMIILNELNFKKHKPKMTKNEKKKLIRIKIKKSLTYKKLKLKLKKINLYGKKKKTNLREWKI